jgi:hypothetical protein
MPASPWSLDSEQTISFTVLEILESRKNAEKSTNTSKFFASVTISQKLTWVTIVPRL